MPTRETIFVVKLLNVCILDEEICCSWKPNKQGSQWQHVPVYDGTHGHTLLWRCQCQVCLSMSWTPVFGHLTLMGTMGYVDIILLYNVPCVSVCLIVSPTHCCGGVSVKYVCPCPRHQCLVTWHLSRTMSRDMEILSYYIMSHVYLSFC